MTKYADIQEELCSQKGSFLSQSIVCEYSEDSYDHFLSILTTPKNCGLLLLLNKLLSSRNPSSCRLAAQLLSNFHEASISISPSLADDPKIFVNQLIEEAKKITVSQQDLEKKIYSFAKQLTEIIDNCKEAYNAIKIDILEKTWRDFAYEFFNLRLQQLNN